MIIGEETETIEFKSTTGELKQACESIAAILNKHCKGTLYFGVDDKGYVKGQQISDNTKKDITRTIYELIEPKITPTIEVLNFEDKKIIKVSFYGYNRPYSCNGIYFSRLGTENRRMATEELRRLLMHNDYSSKWEEEISIYTIKDLDREAILDFYNSAKKSGRLEMKEFDLEQLLARLDLVEGKYVKNGCYALFGKDAKIGLKLARYASDKKITILDLKLLNGNIYNLISKACNYVLDNIDWRVEIGSRKRREVPEIPEQGIREIVVNAFAHSDYETLPEIEIGIYPNFIEIYNPGSFPQDLTPYDFINYNLPSFKRNKLILDILFRSKDVEKTGTGFQRVNELCNEYGCSWDYQKVAYGFIFKFIRSKNYKTTSYKKRHISEDEKIIYDLINNNDKISKSDLAMRIGKSEKTVQRIIKSLTSKNLITRVGSNKNGYWKTLTDDETIK